MNVRIIDATLREGQQSPGVGFTIAQATRIARLLDEIGVDTIECGHAFVNATESRRITALAGLGLSVPLLSHARARTEDIVAAKESGADWIGLFCGINDILRRASLNARSTECVVDMIRRAVNEAKRLGLKVRLTIEDATRTATELVVDVFNLAVEEGADRVCYADTLGAMAPLQFAQAIRAIRAGIGATELEVHVHDDRGFSMANAWVAVEAGATWVSTSVNGLGERCGITDLAGFLANLDLAGDRALKKDHPLQELSRYVGAITRSPPDMRRPTVGRNAFTHTARLHTRAVKKDPASYAIFDAHRVGRQMESAAAVQRRTLGNSVVVPEVICATELKHHRAGPGMRYVMIDDRFVNDARQYCIVRDIPLQSEPAAGHVDPHRHQCDSLFMFIGKGPGLRGLTVEVMLDEETQIIESPAAVFISAGLIHSYRVLGGEGLYVNHVLAGNYNGSLLDEPALPGSEPVGSAESCTDRAYEEKLRTHICLRSRLPVAQVTASTDLFASGAVDSLGLIDLTMFIEDLRGEPVDVSDFLKPDMRTIQAIVRHFLV